MIESFIIDTVFLLASDNAYFVSDFIHNDNYKEVINHNIVRAKIQIMMAKIMQNAYNKFKNLMQF